MVADKFTVESRRKTFEDELNPSIPIYFEIPTAYDYFVKRQSKRSKYGTKITLNLKSDHPFSSSSLIEKISEIAPFIEYQIIVKTNNETKLYEPLLPGDIYGDTPNLKIYFGVTFNELDKSEGIEGTMRVVRTSRERKHLIAQRGFSIPFDKILPSWLSNSLLMSINISGKTKLSLSPNRLNIVEDEKYLKLVEKIQARLICELENSLKTYRDLNTFEKYIQYVDELTDLNLFSTYRHDPPIRSDYMEDKRIELITEIILNNVPFLTISRDGTRAYKFIKDFNNFPTIVVTSETWPEEIQNENVFEEIESLINPDVIVLLGRDTNSRRKYDFLCDILWNPSDIYITSIPGVIVEAFVSNNDSKMYPIKYNMFTFNMHSKTGTKEPLFVHDPEDNIDYETVIFNANHRLLYRFFDGWDPRDENCLEALNYLSTLFSNLLINVVMVAFSPYNRQGIEFKVDQNCSLIGILKRYPDMLKYFYNALVEFWENAQNVGAISYDEEFPGFNEDDLPWFWNYCSE